MNKKIMSPETIKKALSAADAMITQAAKSTNFSVVLFSLLSIYSQLKLLFKKVRNGG
jgi:hypothetical protein